MVIFSPSQLAEGFSALPVNGGETAACESSEREQRVGLLCAGRTKEGSQLGPVERRTRAGGASWNWGLDKGGKELPHPQLPWAPTQAVFSQAQSSR